MNIDQIAEKLGYEIEETVFHKQVGEFHTMFYVTQTGFKQSIAICFFLDKPISEGFIKQAQVALENPYIAGKSQIIGFLLPKISKKMNVTDELIIETQRLLNEFSAYLNENGYHQHDKCFFCKNESEVEEEVVYRDFNSMYVPMHVACYDDFLEFLKQEELAEKKKMKRLPLGILLAVVGALIGLVPTVLVLFFADRIFALLFALMPICAFFGYKLSGAPQTKIMTVVAVLSSLLVVIGFNVVMYVLASMVAEVLLIDLITDLLIDVVFLGIGTLVSWSFITNTKSRKLKEMEK